MVWVMLVARWLAFAIVLVPELLERAHADFALTVLGRIPVREVHPLDRYLGYWGVLATRTTLALLAVPPLALALCARRARAELRAVASRVPHIGLGYVLGISAGAGMVADRAEAAPRLLVGTLTSNPPLAPGPEFLGLAPPVTGALGSRRQHLPHDCREMTASEQLQPY